jgi:hypothetical protein
MDVEFATRGRRMDELVAALRACWGPDPVRFDGEFFHIPDAIVCPKPLQQPHPPLLSGMRSPAGLRRTAAMFDLWNPASGALDVIMETAATIDAMRPEGSEPIQVVQRIFTEPPFVVPGLAPMTIDELCDAVRTARKAGVAHVVVDSGFTTQVESPDDWARFPDLLAPLLDAIC